MRKTAVSPDSIGIEVLERVIRIPWRWIRPFPNQPRTYFDQQELQELADSIREVGQTVPGSVKELPSDNGSPYKYEMIDGQRRWHAIQMAGLTKMKVIVLEVADEAEQFLISVVSNFGRASHGPMEIANAISRFRENGKSVEEIRKIFGKSGAWVYLHIKLTDKLHPDVQKMMSPEIPEEKRLVFSVALVVADVPKDLQKKIATTILSENLKMIQAKDYIRRQGQKHGFTVGHPERTPRSDYRIMERFAAKLQRELGVFTKMPQDFFSKMFEHRAAEDKRQMLLSMQRSIEDLSTLAKAIQGAKK